MGNLVIESGASAEIILTAMRLAIVEDEGVLAAVVDMVAQLQQNSGTIYYQESGNITPSGYALLRVGAAVPFTLPLPPANMLRTSLIIKAMDPYSYTVETSALGIGGEYSTMTWEPVAGNQIALVGLSGTWYIDGIPIGVTLT